MNIVEGNSDPLGKFGEWLFAFLWLTHAFMRITKIGADAPVPLLTIVSAAPEGRPRGGFSDENVETSLPRCA